MKLYQCRLIDGIWTTVAWIEEYEAVVGNMINIVQPWQENGKITGKVRNFMVKTVYEPPREINDT